MISAINLLEIKFSGRVKVPVVDSYQFQALKDQFVIERIVPTPNFDKYVKMHRSELLELPEFEICLNHFLQTAKIQNHLQTISSNRRINQDDINSYFENNFIFALLTKLIISVGCFKFEEQVFESNYVEMERYLFSDCISFTAIVPLRNFESSVENIEFTNEIRISQISNAELTTLLTSNLVHFSKPNCLDAPVLAIKTSFTIQKSDLNHLKIPLDVVEKVVKKPQNI